jgi:hypothetical protein
MMPKRMVWRNESDRLKLVSDHAKSVRSPDERDCVFYSGVSGLSSTNTSKRTLWGHSDDVRTSDYDNHMKLSMKSSSTEKGY